MEVAVLRMQRAHDADNREVLIQELQDCGVEQVGRLPSPHTP